MAAQEEVKEERPLLESKGKEEENGDKSHSFDNWSSFPIRHIVIINLALSVSCQH